MGGNNEEKCLKKTNLLVHQQPTGVKQNRICVDDKQSKYKPPICRPKPKIIRVCTGAEMRKMCPPKMCDCADAMRKPSRILGLLVFGMKAAAAAAAVYVTYDLGVWGTSDDTQNLYRTYCSLTTEPAKKNMGKWDPPSCEAERDLFKIPNFKPYGRCDNPPFDHERSTYNFQKTWNHAVECLFSSLAGLPFNLIDKFKSSRVKDEVVEKKECIPYDQLGEDEKILNNYK